MNLRKIIENVDVEKVEGRLDIEVDNIEYDSRKCKENSLFVAIDGFNVDGHDYVNNAINNGATVVVIEREMIIPTNITVILVKNSRIALSRLSSIFYNEPSKILQLIGITGTNGKTTTTYLIKSILEAYDRKTGLIGTIGNYINDEFEKTKNTTPESLELNKYFNDMLNHGVDDCIMEVSSHSIELFRVEDCDFNIGVFTNLTPEHLDLHKTIENYWLSKSKLFDKTRDFNIINSDDEYGRKIINKIKGNKANLITYGIYEESNVRAGNIKQFDTGVSFILSTLDNKVEINLNTPGIFSVYNALAAASTGIAMGISLEIIKEGLEQISGVKGRFELIKTNKPFNVIIDYAHTPDGYEKVLNTVDEFSKGRKIVIFGCGGDRDKTKRPIMGEIAARYCDLCIVTTDNPRTEDPMSISKDIIEGINKVNGKYVFISDRKEAIKYALINAISNDIILLLGKGHETYQLIGDKVIDFNELEIVKEILESINE